MTHPTPPPTGGCTVAHQQQSGRLRVVPVSLRDAREYVAVWHRHHPTAPRGHKFSLGVADAADYLYPARVPLAEVDLDAAPDTGSEGCCRGTQPGTGSPGGDAA